jgi:hypothetical protein
MRILIFNASPRRNGVTSMPRAEIENNIVSERSVDTITFYKLHMKACIGSLKYRPDKICVLPEDDAHTLAEQVKEPIYHKKRSTSREFEKSEFLSKYRRSQ